MSKIKIWSLKKVYVEMLIFGWTKLQEKNLKSNKFLFNPTVITLSFILKWFSLTAIFFLKKVAVKNFNMKIKNNVT